MRERLLLCTDLDRTLLPNGPQPESSQARGQFATWAADPRLVLAYVTGRDRHLVLEALNQYQLPQPDFVIGDVGTTVYCIEPDGNWRADQAWEAKIGAAWNGKTNRDLQGLLAGIPALQLQERSKQNRYKLSYYLALDTDRKAVVKNVSERLQTATVRARVVWSIDERENIGLLDILPENASKYHAVAMLQQLQGFSDNNTVFCGDSGNDMEVLTSSIPAVLVANSDPEVQREALKLAASSGHCAQLYIARGGYNDMNGNYSAGILEGVAHYHPEWLTR
jgi:sucrose-6F-phosphate phosphohydrolase